MIRLVIFDLDGTLVDSARDLAESANKLIQEGGGTLLEEGRIVRMVGEGARVLVERALSASGLPFEERALQRFLAIYHARLLKHTRPYDGVPETLAVLSKAGIALAVLTNKPLSSSREILAGTGLAPFFGDLIVGGDGPWARKPSPDGLVSLMRKTAHTANETLLVGDSPIDVETARTAGIRMCLARYGFGSGAVGADLEGVDFTIERPGELLEILRERLGGTRRA